MSLISLVFSRVGCFALVAFSIIFASPGARSNPRRGTLHHYTQKSWRSADGLGSDRINAVAQSSNGYLWFATDAGLARFDALRFKVFDSSNTPALKSENITAICEDASDTLWVATSDGLISYKSGEFKRFTTEHGLSSNDLTAVQRSWDGGIWIGTRGSGINRYENGRFRSFSVSDGLAGDSITAILERSIDNHAELFIGTNKGLSIFLDGKFGTFPDIGHVTALFNDGYSNLWIGTADGRVRYLSQGELVDVPFEEEAPKRINAIFHDSQDNLLVGTESGIFLVQKGRLVAFSKRHEFLQNNLSALVEDMEQNLWIGTRSAGVFFLRREKFSTYTAADGLPGAPITAVFGDAQGDVFAACESGIYRLERGRFEPFLGALPAEDDAASTTAVEVEDHLGRFWSNTQNGILRREGSKPCDLEDGATSTDRCVLYGLKDGLKEVGTAARGADSAWKAPDGRIWFAVGSGVSVVDPRVLSTGKAAPSVHFDKVIVDGREVRMEDTIVIEPGVRSIEVHFTAISYSDPEDVRFKYILYGKKGAKWHELGKMHHGSVLLTDLAPGDNWITLAANNSDNPVYENMATLSFKRSTALKASSVVETILFVLISALLVGAYLYRDRILKKRRKRA